MKIKKGNPVDETTCFAPCDQRERSDTQGQLILTFVKKESGEERLEQVEEELSQEGLSRGPFYSCPCWFSEVSKSVEKWWKQESIEAYHPQTDLGALRTLTLREGVRTEDKMVVLTVSGNPDFILNRTQIEGFKQAVFTSISTKRLSLFLRIQRTEQSKDKTFYEIHLSGPDCLTDHLRIRERSLISMISPGSFFHSHLLEAEKWYEKGLTLAEPKSTDTVLDLYAGTGIFSLVFAPYVQTVIAIEKSPYPLCDAERMIKENSLLNVFLMKGSVESEIGCLKGPIDLAILNLPRCGMTAHALYSLLDLFPKKVLYFSSHGTKEEDKGILNLEKGGYRLKTFELVDPFFYGDRLKNIAVLEKREIRYTQKNR